MADYVYFSEKYTITQFCGKKDEGMCVQIIPSNFKEPYFKLTKKEALEFISAILDWVVRAEYGNL